MTNIKKNSIQEKTTKDAYFQMLEYGYLLAPKGNSVDESLEAQQTRETAKAYARLN